MRRALSLGGPKLLDIQIDTVHELSMPSELKICDVQEIFTRFKKVPAEKIIARLLGEVHRHKKVCWQSCQTRPPDQHQVSRGLVCKKVQWRWKGQ